MVYAQHLKCCLHCGYGFESHPGHHMKMSKSFLNKDEQNSLFSILEKVNTAKESDIESRLISFAFLNKILDASERALIKKVLEIDPHDFDFKGKFLGIKPVPKNLYKISHARIQNQFLPRRTLSAFNKMNDAMFAEIGERVEILSGYRSPAYQAIVFLWNLRAKKYDLQKTVSAVALPGYSEHNDAKNTGIDLICSGTKISLTTTPTFAKTAQYRWLQKNAHKFGFTESFPKKNKLGVIYEPWHWRYLV